MLLASAGRDALFARNEPMTEEQLRAIRHNMGLDRPWPEQLVNWILHLLRGDLGISYSQCRPVSHVIDDVAPNTFLLMGAGLVISLISAVVFGIAAARRPRIRTSGTLSQTLTLLAATVPSGWSGLAPERDSSVDPCSVTAPPRRWKARVRGTARKGVGPAMTGRADA
jgi:ABC-type dipeptide/oligopeptide/nickel transport system permease component